MTTQNDAIPKKYDKSPKKSPEKSPDKPYDFDDVFLLAVYNKGLVDILDDVYNGSIRLDGNSSDDLNKVSALIEAIVRNAKKLEKKCRRIVDYESA